MGIKFDDEVAAPQPKSKIRFTDKESKDKEPDPSSGKKDYAFSYGVSSNLLGSLGDTENFLVNTVPEFFGASKNREKFLGRETIFPTSEEVKQVADYIGIPKPIKGTEESERAGEIAPAVVAGGKGLYDLGKFGFNLAKKSLSAPRAIGQESTFSELGTKIENFLKGEKGKGYKARKIEADNNYQNAKDIALAEQGSGNAFAQSRQGQKLIKELEESKYTYSNGKRFLKSEPEIKAIDHLIEVLKPEVSVTQRTALSTNPFAAKTTVPGIRKETQKGIEAIIDELRQLREVNKPGVVSTNYGGLSAKYVRDLIAKIEGDAAKGTGLYGWSPEYAKADKLYKAASDKLKPFETELMRKVLREEKYVPGETVKDVESFAGEFFKNGDTVKQLKDATGDPKMVFELAKDYASTILANKTPKQIKDIAFDPKNEGWLRESGIKDIVQKYANEATSAQTKKDVLKYLAYASGVSYATHGALTTYFGFK